MADTPLGTTPILPLGNKTVGNAYAGPNSDEHVEVTAEVRGHTIKQHKPKHHKPDEEYPKYVYPKDGSAAKLVNSKDEHDALEGEHAEEPPSAEKEEVVPLGADDADLDGMNRVELASFGNRTYNLNLQATQSKDSLKTAIKAAALAKNDNNNQRAERQQLDAEKNDRA